MAKRSTQKPVSKKRKEGRSSWPKQPWWLTSNEFIDRNLKTVIGFLLGLSLLLSIIYYTQSANGPITSFYKWDNSDMYFFDVWAKHIANEDVWCDTVLHPYHNWHDMLATEYFHKYPALKAQYGAQQDSLSTDAAKHALINDIYKGKTYHQEPLYAYLLAATYAIFGPDHKWVYFWQFLLAACTSVLVFLTGRKLFSPLTGLAAALFVTLCGSIMVYEMVLLRTTMTNFFTVLLLYLFLRLLESPTIKRNIIFGVASGFALLGQSFLILFLVPAWIYFLGSHRKKIREVLPGFAIGIASFLFVLLPLFIRNSKSDVPLTSMASQGAMAYIPMNTQYSQPMESFFIHMPSLAEIRYESQGKMLAAVTECLQTFDSFGSFLKIYLQKINGMFMWYEIPNNVNYYLFREIAPVLKYLPIHYYFIAPLGLAGLALCVWRYRSKAFPIVWITLVSMVPLMIAGNLARYRTPLVILFCLFAAYFLMELIILFYQKKYKPAFLGIGLTLLAFIYTSNASPKSIFVYNESDIDTFYRYYYKDQLMKYESKADFNGYLSLTNDMMENIPDYFFKVPLSQKIVSLKEAGVSKQIANFMESHYNVLTYLKRTQEAAFFKERFEVLRARRNEFSARTGVQQ